MTPKGPGKALILKPNRWAETGNHGESMQTETGEMKGGRVERREHLRFSVLILDVGRKGAAQLPLWLLVLQNLSQWQTLTSRGQQLLQQTTHHHQIWPALELSVCWAQCPVWVLIDADARDEGQPGGNLPLVLHVVLSKEMDEGKFLLLYPLPKEAPAGYRVAHDADGVAQHDLQEQMLISNRDNMAAN